MKTKYKLIASFALSLVLFYLMANAVQAESQIGVGIMPGVIRVDKPLIPGGKYSISSVQVVNTGNITSQYELVTVKMASQNELQPPAEFITINPKSFSLEPGANQVISLNLNIPANATPGDYLGYVEAHPVSQSTGGTTIGIAAATKIYFTVIPVNAFQALTNVAANVFNQTAPFSYILAGISILALIVFFSRRYLKFEIKLSRKEK